MLTLLGVVLAIGLVVDDSIVVLENIVRRTEQGEAPVLASISGSREIGFAVLAVTTVLVTVFLPISFMPGKLGRLFGEFGISVATAVAFSALVALTLVPMLSSLLFTGHIERGRFATWVDKRFQRLADWYRRATHRGARACAASSHSAPSWWRPSACFCGKACAPTIHRARIAA